MRGWHVILRMCCRLPRLLPSQEAARLQEHWLTTYFHPPSQHASSPISLGNSEVSIGARGGIRGSWEGLGYEYREFLLVS